MSEDVGTNDSSLADLRQELKRWEKAFAAANGRKAGRVDIDQDANISAKYREYNRLAKRRVKPKSSPNQHARSQPDTTRTEPLRERSSNVINATPKKTTKHVKDVYHPESLTIVEEEPTPACVRHALGPTPQKDGAILGLFDSLHSATPSRTGDTRNVQVEPAVAGTPSKPTLPASSGLALSDTPQSSGKRFMLGAFAGTPLKRKREHDINTPSTAKRQYATPSFLRRNLSLGRIDEEQDDDGMVAPPFKKRNLVRSLSTIIQGLKKHEEERMNDEWDVINEIEAEERGETTRPNVLVEDSQAVEMPLGPDQGVESADEASEVEAGSSTTRKSWKKKGLKRQTRRVIMRPVKHQPKKAADDRSSDSEESEAEAIAETQTESNATRTSRAAEAHSEPLEDDNWDSQHDSQQSHHRPAEKSTERKKGTNKKSKPSKQAEGDAEAKKRTSKASSLAHANFRKLNIKNKNSKAKGGGRRFGRR